MAVPKPVHVIDSDQALYQDLSTNVTISVLDHLWLTLPAERENLRVFIEKAKGFVNECGCAMSGAFFIGSLVILIFYSLQDGLGEIRWFRAVFWGVIISFGSSIVGKSIGIGVARIRLMLLHRQVRKRYVTGRD